MKKLVSALAIIVLLAGCASQPEDIAASSVSTLQYQDYNCKQISLELDRIERKVNDLYYRLDKKAGNDGAQMAIGIVLFWPALFFLEGGDGPEAAEYARLKGELEALETVSIHKKCAIKFPEPPKRKQAPAPSQNKSHD
jgi:hypothetical protein